MLCNSKKLFLLTALAGALISCSKISNLTLSSLGNLDSPVASAAYSNPTASGFPNSISYMEFGGSCSPLVDHFELGLDRYGTSSIEWYTISKTGPTIQASDQAISPMLPAGYPTSYDVNCADGTFYFYVFKNQLDNFLNSFQSGLNTSNVGNVSAIKIRGVTLGGIVTDTLYYYSNNLSLAANFPRNVLNDSLCTGFFFSTSSANTGRKVAISASSGGTSSTFGQYSDIGCTVAATNFTLTQSPTDSQQSSFMFYVKTVSPTEASHIFVAKSTDSGPLISVSKTIYVTHMSDYVDFDFPDLLQQNECYAIRMVRGSFSHGNNNGDAPNIVFSASGTDLNSSSCLGGMSSNTYAFASSNTATLQENVFYFKPSTPGALLPTIVPSGNGNTYVPLALSGKAVISAATPMDTSLSSIRAYTEIDNNLRVTFYNTNNQQLTLHQLFSSGFSFNLFPVSGPDISLSSYSLNYWNGGGTSVSLIKTYGPPIIIPTDVSLSNIIDFGAHYLMFKPNSPMMFPAGSTLQFSISPGMTSNLIPF